MNRRYAVVAAVTAVSAWGLGSCAAGPSGQTVQQSSMWIHFDDASLVESAMVRGDLQRARRAAANLAEMEAVPGLPDSSDELLQRLRSQARAIASANRFQTAAEATGAMAATCGECHARYDGGPRLSRVPEPPDPAEVGHMVLHVWAADRMWEGLMIPSEGTWLVGARLLADHAVRVDGPYASPRANQLALEMKELGGEAVAATGSDARGRVLGAVLNSCATCHAELDIR